jgi:hypothetical protein
MQNIGINFLKCAVLYAIAGMALGIYMGITNDHSQAPTHAHNNLLGWVSMALMGLTFRTWPKLSVGGLPKAIFWLMNAGTIVMVLGLWQIFSGNDVGEKVVAVGSLIVLLTMILFAVVVYRANTSD